MRSPGLVHHREGVRGQRVMVREHRQQHPVPGPQPAAAVRVSRSPGCQPSAVVMARPTTLPDSSIRPIPYTTSSGTAGTSDAAAIGRRQAC